MSICDASSSWSGYQYQGKVSIYIVLKMINKFIREGITENIDKYSIEIESREDFSIKNKGKYESIHQVKAKLSDTTINPYLEAMEKLNKEKKELPYSNLYLHTVAQISNWNIESFKETLNVKIINITKKIWCTKKEEEKSKFRYEIEKYDKLLNDKNFFNNVNLYHYSNGKHNCSLDEIKDLIGEEIQNYFILTNQNKKLGSVDIIYNQLIGFLDEYIKERHKGNAVIDMYFHEFSNRLNDDRILERDENFHLYNIKERYIYNIHKYCENICNKKENCKINISNCNLIELVKSIEEIKLNDFKKFICKINPHVNISNWERDNGDFSNEICIYFLCNMLNNEIEQSYEIDDNTLLYKHNYNSYMPTTINTINNYMINEVAELYIKNIKKNDFLLNELFESNIFITDNLNKENILEDITDVEEVDEEKKLRDIELEDKQYLKNRVDFKDITTVKEELKNEGVNNKVTN